MPPNRLLSYPRCGHCGTLCSGFSALENAMPTLLYSPTSPYARKVRVLIRECGLSERIDEQIALPLDDPAALLAATPLGKVQALRLDDGTVLFDSRVICAWLAAQGRAQAGSPDSMSWQTQRRPALAVGVLAA